MAGSHVFNYYESSRDFEIKQNQNTLKKNKIKLQIFARFDNIYGIFIFKTNLIIIQTWLPNSQTQKTDTYSKLNLFYKIKLQKNI